MNRIDTFAGESNSSLAGGSRSKRSASFEKDHGAFENALDRSREEASEAGYGVTTSSAATPPAPKPITSGSSAHINGTLEKTPGRDEKAVGAVQGKSASKAEAGKSTEAVQSATVDSTAPKGEANRVVEAADAVGAQGADATADGSELESAEETQVVKLVKEVASDSEPELDASEGEVSTSESAEVSESADAGADADAEMGSEAAELSGDEEAGETAQTDEFEAEVEFSEIKNGASSSKSEEVQAPRTPAAASGDSAALLEARGKQVFAKAATQQKTVTAPTPVRATVDVEDLASQIDKARGTMSGGRARIVLGEGSERVALLVQLKNGSVSVDLRAADGALAENLARSSDDLAKALGRHGLTLGDMSTGSEAKGDGTQQEMKGEHGPPLTEKDTPATPAHTLRRAGIRVVA